VKRWLNKHYPGLTLGDYRKLMNGEKASKQLICENPKRQFIITSPEINR
jgi:hypothetical protein